MSIEETIGVVPLEECCAIFGLTAEKAKERARSGDLPVPAFHLGSTRSPWYVSKERLRKFVIECDKQAAHEHKAVNAE